MKPSSLIIRTLVSTLLLHVVYSNLTTRDDDDLSDPLEIISDQIKWLRPIRPKRVKRSAIVYNKCPTGYKKMPPPIMCISCQQYEKITGESC